MDFTNNDRVSFDQECNAYIYTAEDGIEYQYDAEKSTWFPRFDEELVQTQQSVYDAPEKETNAKEETKAKEETGKRRGNHEQKSRKRIKDSNTSKSRPNTSVYVTGLPPDTTIEEMKAMFSKCGIILEDPLTQQPKIKLYHTSTGSFKGEALVIYFKEESVQLAIDLLDESVFRPGVDASVIRVQKAVFQDKQEDASNVSHLSSIDEANKKKMQKARQKLER